MATDTITALGAGSGVDVKSLATSLVEAERAPAKAIIDKKITKSEAVVSGYSAVKYALSTLQAAFADLKDQTDFESISVNNSQSSAFSASTSSGATAGSHSVVVNSLAVAQRNTSAGFATTATKLNNGSAITLTLTGAGFPQVSNADQTISVTTDTPAGIVDAINKSGKGLSAHLVNTRDAAKPYQIVVTGKTGLANSFSLTATGVAGLDFGTNLQTAKNASLTVDGIAISSSSNQVQEAISGVTLNLLAPTATTTTTQTIDSVTSTVTTPVPATLDLTHDTSTAKTKIQALVTAYNDVNDFLKETLDSKSTLATYGGTLVGNSSIAHIKSQLREMMNPGATGNSSTPSGDIKAMRDIGLEIDSTGKMTVNSVKLDMALMFNFDATVTMLSGNQENQSTSDTGVAGIAGDSFKKITAMLATTGSLTVESNNASKRITDYQDRLAKLEERMTALLARYTKQFAAMDSIVGQTNSLRTSLTATFDGMMSIYTKK